MNGTVVGWSRAGAWLAAAGISRLGSRLVPRETASSSLAVLIHTFDGYQRYWRPAAHFSRLNLPSTQDVYFATEQRTLDEDRLIPVLTGDGSFVRRLLRAATDLERRGHRYILYLQEDMWLTEPIDAARLDELVELMDRHRLDSLKLGYRAVWKPEIPSLGAAVPLDARGPGRAFSWFGPLSWAMSHHVTIFRPRFLIRSLHAAAVHRQVGPIEHEIFCSRYLGPRLASRSGDGKRFRIAAWNERPAVHYVHASADGRLTRSGRELLHQAGVAHLYRPELDRQDGPEPH